MSQPRTIFVTGATGFVGSHLVLHLLRTTDASIVCLARSSRTAPADTRVRNKLRRMVDGRLGNDDRFAVSPDAWRRLTVVDGDVTGERLGIDAAVWQSLHIDEVWHVAASVTFDAHKHDEVLATNVGGTRNVLALVRDRRVPALHYVSTAYVAGQRSGEIPETAVCHEFAANNPYEHSKRVCEQEVAAASAAHGFEFRIFRPSVVIGHSRTMEGDPTAGLGGYVTVLLRVKEMVDQRMPDYFLHNELKLGFADHVTLNLIAVDHVVEAMVNIAARPESRNDHVHIVNPRPMQVASYLGSLGAELGIRIVNVPDVSHCGPIDHLVWVQTEVFRAYLQDAKTFRCDKLLALGGVSCEQLQVTVEQERGYTRWVRGRFDQDRRVLSQRMTTTTRVLQRRSLTMPGSEPLAYYRGGEGDTTLVVINAYGQSLAFWDRTISALVPGCNVITWQIRGTSSNGGGITSVHAIDGHLEDLAAILRTERVTSCTLLAWCTGPKLALELAHRYPELVSSMVLLSGCFKNWPAMESLYTEYERCMDQLCRAVVQRPAIAMSIMDTLKEVLSSQTRADATASREHHDRLLRGVLALMHEDIKPLVLEPFLTEANVVSYARQLLGFWEHPIADRLDDVRVPVLLVAGELDDVAAAAMSRAVARRIPGAVYAEVVGGSHYMQFDNHELLVDLLGAFLRAPGSFRYESGLVRVHRESPPAIAPTGAGVART